MKVKYQLVLTHGLLVILSLVIILFNMMAYKGMESDASIINQSGRLRALSYNMVQLANRINNQDDDSYTVKLKEDLQYRVDEFDGSLRMLSDIKNNSNVGITHKETIGKLEKVTAEWEEVFKPSYLKIVKNESTKILYTQVNSEIDSYVNDINEMVTSYSIYSRDKVSRALTVNGGLVVLLIIVTLYSFITTSRRIQRPMKILMQELKELSLLDDEVSKKLKSLNTDEISEMTQYFNEMMYDQLTKTFNRRSGLAKLNKMFQYKNRRNLEMSLCFIDINGLKMVNDQLGHKLGDELIVIAIDSIKQEIRDEDFIVRMGGDEFLIVFKGINEADSEKVWERINNRYQFINEDEDRPYIISVSHGVVEYDNLEKPDVELMIKKADDKMYEEKKYIKEELKLEIIKHLK